MKWNTSAQPKNQRQKTRIHWTYQNTEYTGQKCTQPSKIYITSTVKILINTNKFKWTKTIFDKSSLFVLPDTNLFTYTRFLQWLRLFKTNKQMTRGGSYELPEYLHCMTWLVNLSFGNFFYGWINCLILLSIHCTVYMILWGKICPLGVIFVNNFCSRLVL